MARRPVIAAALILPGLAVAQPADDAAKCQAAAGFYLTGTVVSGPRFKPGAPLHGTYLSHTHLTLRGDADGRPYDVAIDNVFANGYRSWKAVLRPVACDQVRGARGRGQGTETVAKLGGLPPSVACVSQRLDA